MTGPAVSTDVLIVGAGPTGLTLACALARAGVRFHLVDRITARSPHSRALIVHLRSLEILNQLGVAQDLIALGNQGTEGRVFVRRKLKATFKFFDQGYAGCRYRSALFIEQGKTEAALESRVGALGGATHLGHEVVSFNESPRGVRAVVRTAKGEYEVACAYIAGCDGAHSVVRHGKDIAFRGAAYAQDFMLADADVKWELPRGAFTAFQDRQGFLVAIPMRDKTRLISSRGRYREDAPDPTLDDFRTLFDRLVPCKAELSNPVWLARFHLHHRIADRFRAGRVMLAGDAAHIHSPVGGQGMNTGIQDAWNLGWKLAWAVRSPSTADGLLDSYHEERRPVGVALLRTTDQIFNFVAGQSSLNQFVRGAVMPWLIPLVGGMRWVRRAGVHRVSQLGIHYRHGGLGGPDADHTCFTRALKPGDRVPDIDVGGESLHAMLDPLRLTVLAAGVRGDAPRCKVIELAQPSREQKKLLGLKDSGCLLIRPDGHLAARAASMSGLSRTTPARLAPTATKG